jgi:hemerythrin
MSDVPEIDQQHRELVNLVSRLNDVLKKGESRETIYKIIDDVIAYTRFHFANEERLMAEYGYPEIETHVNMHKQLVNEALQLKKKLDHVGVSEFLDWFNHWPFANILAHIQYADNQIKEYISQSGLDK